MRWNDLFLVAGAIGAIGCGGGNGGITGTTQLPGVPAGPPPAAASVSVNDNFYSPGVVLVAAGGTVTWTWAGSGHSVTSTGTPSFSPNSPVRNAGTTLGPVVFATVGNYQYFCTVHGTGGYYGGSQMTGVVYVR